MKKKNKLSSQQDASTGTSKPPNTANTNTKLLLEAEDSPIWSLDRDSIEVMGKTEYEREELFKDTFGFTVVAKNLEAFSSWKPNASRCGTSPKKEWKNLSRWMRPRMTSSTGCGTGNIKMSNVFIIEQAAEKELSFLDSIASFTEMACWEASNSDKAVKAISPLWWAKEHRI